MPETTFDELSLLPDGHKRPLRKCPADFADQFIALGWVGVTAHYRTNWRIIRRWIEESGGDTLREKRRAVSGGTERPTLRAGHRARNYVLGRRLSHG